VKVGELIKILQALDPMLPLLTCHTTVSDEEFVNRSWREGSFAVTITGTGVYLTRKDTEHWDTE
jgi:hypothetical protein